MARQRSRADERATRTEIEDLLARRRPPQARRVLELIHEVNPTGRTVGDRDAVERYALKAQLQTLLVEHFSGELIVEPDDRPGVVGLRLRSLALDACHAVLAELGEEARSWVQFQLDTRAFEVPAAKRELHPRALAGRTDTTRSRGAPRARAGLDQDHLSHSDLVEQARREIAQFAYDDARATLSRALAASAPGAALLLTQLLVDTLCADDDAMALEETIADEDRERPELRVLLALAAARAGKTDDAMRLLGTLEVGDSGSARAAEVLVVLARGALGALAADGAEALLGEARRFDAAHPDLVILSDEIAALRRAARAPLERDLEEAWTKGSLQAEPMARDLLDLFPDSRVAGRVLKQIEARRREEEARLFLARASAALFAGDHDGATRAVHDARVRGAKTTELERAIEAAVAEGRHADVLRVALELGASLDAGLRSYARLGDDARSLVRARTKLVLLGWLDQALASGRAARDPSAAVAAVAALADAIEFLRDGRVEDLHRALAPHEQVLRHVPRARQLEAELEQLLQQRRRESATVALRSIRAALNEGDLTESGRLLDGLDTHGCGAELMAQAASVTDEHGRLVETALAIERLESMLLQEDFLAALHEVELLIASDANNEQRWRARRDAIDAQVRRLFSLRISKPHDEDDEPLLGALAIDKAYLSAGPCVWLSDDQLFVCTCAGPWIFIGAYDLACARFRELVQLRVPGSMQQLDLHVDGTRVLVWGESGLLELDRSTWRIAAWRPLAKLVGPDDILDDLVIAPGASHLWVETRQRGASSSSSLVIDVQRWTSQREIKDVHPIAIHGVDGALVASHLYGDDGGARLYTARGQPKGHLSFEAPTRVHALSTHPERSADLMAIVGPERDPFVEDARDTGEDASEDAGRDTSEDIGEEADERGVVAVELLRDDGWRPSAGGACIEGMFEDGPNSLATSLDERCSFFLFTSDQEEKQLAAFCRSVPSGKADIAMGDRGRLAVLYRVAVPEHHTLLAQDACAKRALLLTTAHGKLHVAPLHRSPPALPAGSPGRRHLPRLDPPFLCDWNDPTEYELAREVRATLARLPRDLRLGRVKTDIAGKTGEVVVSYLHALELLGEGEGAAELARIAAVSLPDNASLAMCRAGMAAALGRWQEVLALLSDEMLFDRLAGNARGHFCHLLGIARLRANEPGACDLAREAARATWTRGVPFERDCRLADCVELVSPLPEPLTAEHWGPDQPLLRQLLGAVQVADDCLRRGDVGGAIEAVERAAVLTSGELQSLSRLAEAHLQHEPRSEGERFAKTLALATFIAVAKDNHHERRADLPLTGAFWPAGRITPLVERASAWLSNHAA